MSENSTASKTEDADLQQRLLDATVPYALMALGLHMAENHLPNYLRIDTPHIHHHDVVRIHVRGEAVDAWVESIHVDEQGTRPRPTSDVYPTEAYWTGRLPIAGVRVELFELRDTPALTAVPS